MKIGVNLTAEEAKALKARKEQELGVGSVCSPYAHRSHTVDNNVIYGEATVRLR